MHFHAGFAKTTHTLNTDVKAALDHVKAVRIMSCILNGLQLLCCHKLASLGDTLLGRTLKLLLFTRQDSKQLRGINGLDYVLDSMKENKYITRTRCYVKNTPLVSS